MISLILIRHAETDMSGRFCGHSDPDLNAAGRARLPSIARQTASLGIRRIFSSDLLRAARTADSVGHATGLKIELLPALREIHFGQWEGLNWVEIEARFPRHAQAWIREFPARGAPGGESYQDFSRRIDRSLDSIARGGANSIAAVVTHRGVMRHVLSRICGWSERETFERTAYGAIVPVVYPPGAAISPGSNRQTRHGGMSNDCKEEK